MDTQALLSLVLLPSYLRNDRSLESSGSEYLSINQEKKLLDFLECVAPKYHAIRILLPVNSNLEYFKELTLNFKTILTLDYCLGDASNLRKENTLFISDYLVSEFLDYRLEDNSHSPQDNFLEENISETINDLRNLLIQRIHEVEKKLDVLPHLISSNLEKSKILLSLSNYIPLRSEINELSISLTLNRHTWELLLAAHVIIDTCLHSKIDPVEGWLNKSTIKNSSKTAITSPFIYAISDENNSTPRLYYTPRKTLISPLKDNFCLAFKTEETKWKVSSECHTNQNSTQSQSTPMRNSPNLYGIKLRRHLDSIDSFSVLYLKSNLGGFEKESTSGVQLDYWYESIGSYMPTGTSIAFFASILFPSYMHSLSFRYLSSFGGSSTNLFPAEPVMKINSIDQEGDINGVRIIDGINHLIMDLRLFTPLNSIEILSSYQGANTTKIDIHLVFPIESISKLKEIQTFHLSIY